MHDLGRGITVFAGQRAEGFYVDLGSIFDLGNLRPFQELTRVRPARKLAAPGRERHRPPERALDRHPGADVARDRERHPTIGVWTSASRQRARVWDADSGQNVDSGPFRQVSRLGNPLVNEVIIPLGKKDLWNSLPPDDDKLFAQYVAHPELAALLPVLYPGVFPAPGRAGRVREAARRPGGDPAHRHPRRHHPGFTNYTGPVLADMLRLNTSIAPTPAAKQSIYGLLGGDTAGYPNGRRVTDDVTAIELRAIAGVTYALVDKSYTPDAAAGELTDGLTPASVSSPYLDVFPYLGVPYSGYDNPS